MNPQEKCRALIREARELRADGYLGAAVDRLFDAVALLNDRTLVTLVPEAPALSADEADATEWTSERS
jgi:hypothetical protein